MCSLIPLAVVRGLQLGVGLNLAQKGVSLVWFKDAKVGVVRDLSGSDSLFLGLSGAIFILLTVLPYEKLELPAAAVTKQPAEELEVPQQGPEEVEGQTVTTVSPTFDSLEQSQAVCILLMCVREKLKLDCMDVQSS